MRNLEAPATVIPRAVVAALLAFAALEATPPASLQAQFGTADPLPSWNEGAAKEAILSFVQRVTDDGGPEFVAVEDRIATFDNDGTLWSEKPLPTEVYFILARLRELAASDPVLRSRQPFKAALEGDADYFHQAGEAAVAELISVTHAGMTQEEFAAEARRFFDEEQHPTLHREFTSLAYVPMLELLAYLRANGFETWISSGGTIDFVRAFAPDLYGVPADQVIGSELAREVRRTGSGILVHRLPSIEHLNDRDGKPLGIDRHVGRRPILVAGNVLSGGDVAMMEYSRSRAGPSLQLLVDHDDSVREFAYSEADGASLAAAATHGFTVVSTRADWKKIFVWE
jgi:phosphoserine phosphatase